jgi:hypothetical protein
VTLQARFFTLSHGLERTTALLWAQDTLSTGTNTTLLWAVTLVTFRLL